jgi:hypothetical protein
MWRAAAKLPPARIRPSRVGERIDHARGLVQAVRHSAHMSALVIVTVALALGGVAIVVWSAHGPAERLGAPDVRTIMRNLYVAPAPPPPPPPCSWRRQCMVE